MNTCEYPIGVEHRVRPVAPVTAALRLFANGLACLQHRQFAAPWRAPTSCDG